MQFSPSASSSSSSACLPGNLGGREARGNQEGGGRRGRRGRRGRGGKSRGGSGRGGGRQARGRKVGGRGEAVNHHGGEGVVAVEGGVMVIGASVVDYIGQAMRQSEGPSPAASTTAQEGVVIQQQEDLR